MREQALALGSGVEQADRDRAADQLRTLERRFEADSVTEGQDDRSPLVQAFARHRQLGIAQGKREAAEIAKAQVGEWSTFSDCLDFEDAYTDACNDISSAILTSISTTDSGEG